MGAEVSECNECKRRASIYWIECRGCRARGAARAPAVVRKGQIYPAFKREFGEAELEKFKAECKAEWDRDQPSATERATGGAAK